MVGPVMPAMSPASFTREGGRAVRIKPGTSPQKAVLLRGTVMVGWNEGSVFTVWRRTTARGWFQSASFTVPGVRDAGEATVIACEYVDSTVGSEG